MTKDEQDALHNAVRAHAEARDRNEGKLKWWQWVLAIGAIIGFLAFYTVMGIGVIGCSQLTHKVELIDADECECDMPWSPFLDPCCIGEVEECEE